MGIDYHVHSSISPDGKSDMQEICIAAVNKGITDLAFTEHFEFYENSDHNRYFNEAYLEKYWENFQICKQVFEDKIQLKFGLEMGQPYLEPKKAAFIINRYPFDYILASVHKIHDIDLKQMNYADEITEEIGTLYYEEVLRMCYESDFDCIAHLDLYKRYAKLYGNYKENSRHRFLIEKILQIIIERDKGIEINASGYKIAEEPLPGKEVISYYWNYGGRKVTVGSDAHRSTDVGNHFARIQDLLSKVGVTYMTGYEKRNAVKIDII